MAVRRSAPAPMPNSFVASAMRLPQQGTSRPQIMQSWMEEAWYYYDTVPELRFVSNWVGSVMSRAILKVAVEEEDGVLRIEEDGPAADAMDSYFGSAEGRSSMLNGTGINLTVTGETYHVMIAETEQWYVLASGRVTRTGGGSSPLSKQKIYADYGDGKRLLTEDDLITRIWVPHPRDPLAADSPVRSNRGTLRELQRLNEHISAQLDSRLAGAGVMFMPSEIQFPVPEGMDPQATQADAFMQVLGETMMTPIKDRSSAAAVVPLIVTAPGEVLDKVKHVTFWTPLEDAVTGMRENAIKHLALGLDTPPEVLMGVSDANHWNAWLVDEAAVKSHLEPRLQVVASAITTSYLRPAIEGQVADAWRYHVIADTSSLRLRPDLTTQAIDLWDRGELSGAALRRETGFEPADAPTDEDVVQWLLKKVATGSTSPEQTIAALNRLGADLNLGLTDTTNKPAPDDLRIGTRPGTTTRAPQIEKALDRVEKIRRGEEKASAVVAACDALVYRALERAGNKLCDAKAKANGLGTVIPHERYLHASGPPDALLDGAWTTCAQVLDEVCEDPASVTTALDMYVRGLLTGQTPHTREAMRVALSAGGVL